MATVDLGTAHLNNASRWSRKSNLPSLPPPTHPSPHTHTHNLLQVTNAMEYYFVIRDITDDQVVDQLLGIPTYKLQEFIDVRTGVIGDFAAQQGCVAADLAGSR